MDKGVTMVNKRLGLGQANPALSWVEEAKVWEMWANKLSVHPIDKGGRQRKAEALNSFIMVPIRVLILKAGGKEMVKEMLKWIKYGVLSLRWVTLNHPARAEKISLRYGCWAIAALIENSSSKETKKDNNYPNLPVHISYFVSIPEHWEAKRK